MPGEKDQSGTTSLTNSEVKTMAIATHPNEAGQSGTQFGKNYLKDYLKIGLSKSTEVPEAPPAKQKELHFQKDSRKNNKAIRVSF